MTRKKAFKQLRKNLDHNFTNPYTKEYECYGAIRSWVQQCGMKCTDKHLQIILEINNGTVYPYVKRDRRTVIKYLKRNKKWKS